MMKNSTVNKHRLGSWIILLHCVAPNLIEKLTLILESRLSIKSKLFYEIATINMIDDYIL